MYKGGMRDWGINVDIEVQQTVNKHANIKQLKNEDAGNAQTY